MTYPLIALKDGIQPRGLLDIFAAVVNVAYRMKLPQPVTLTACIDGKHTRKSKHYQLAALDVRSKDFTPADKEAYLTAVRGELGPDFDVILEGEGTANEHFHIEFDP